MTTRGYTDKQLAYQNTIMKKYNCENRATVLNFWIRVSQQDHFREEFEILEKGQKIPKSSKLFEINPFIQKSTNLLRVKGRLEYFDTDCDTKYPIILPPKVQIKWIDNTLCPYKTDMLDRKRYNEWLKEKILDIWDENSD